MRTACFFLASRLTIVSLDTYHAMKWEKYIVRCVVKAH